MRRSGLRFLCGMVGVILCFLFVAEPVMAMDKTLYSQNNILFYDADDNNDKCGGGNGSVVGGTVGEKIWSGLTGIVGLTEEQAAGVLGNMMSESGLNPAKHEISAVNSYQPGFDLEHNTSNAYGLGLIQWSFGRRTQMYAYVKSKNASLLKYLEDYAKYSTNLDGEGFLKAAGNEVANELIQYEMEFLRDELKNNGSYSGIYKTNSVREAAQYFLEHVEIPANPTLAAHPERATQAESFYKEYAGKTISEGATKVDTASGNDAKADDTDEEAASGEASDGGSDSNGNDAKAASKSEVTIIGDSIAVGAESAVKEKMPKAEINAEVGRQWVAGLSVLGSAKGNVVYALGTNNWSPSLSESDVSEMVSKAGEKNIYLVTNFSTDKKYEAAFEKNNTIFNEAAKKYSNVKVIDWKGAASADAEKYLSSDGLHPTSEGAKLWAELITKALAGGAVINECGEVGEGASALADYVLKYAWPEYKGSGYVERKPDYKAAVEKRMGAGLYVGGTCHGGGVDCGGFVTTLMNESGYEPEYNYSGKGGNTTSQLAWVRENWTTLNDSPTTEIDTSKLQAGDVAVYDGHTFVYVGEIEGFDSRIASASLCNRAPMAGRESLTYDSYHGQVVMWFRKGAK